MTKVPEQFPNKEPTYLQIKVFGRERMEQVAGNEATIEDAAALLNAIEAICSDEQAISYGGGVKHRSVNKGDRKGLLSFRTNPRGVRVEGHGEMHQAVGSIDWLTRKKVLIPRSLTLLPRIEYEAREGIFITDLGQAMVQRGIYRLHKPGRAFTANKPATVSEIGEAWNILTEVVAADDDRRGQFFGAEKG